MPASWIADPDAPGDVYGVYHFRRALDLRAAPSRFVVHVSADNRYRLFVNGTSVASGPQRSDVPHWRYETVDLAPFLRAGRNVLAAEVWNWGAYRPVAQCGTRTGFLVQGDGAAEAAANTGPGWKVLRDSAYRPIPISFADVRGYYAAPPGENVDGAAYPWGWERVDYDDARWRTIATGAGGGVIGRVQLYGVGDLGAPGTAPWQLQPRTIPPMEEAPVRFASVRRAQGVSAGDAFLRGTGALVIPARTRATLLLDNGQLTNAYPVVETSGGAGSSITLTYAEALRDAQGRKGNRDSVEGKTIAGVRDVVRPGGGAERRRFRALWFRTYRYVQLDVETAAEPLSVHDVSGVFTGYPLVERARFASDLPWLADMWRMNWRGARLDAWETYFDTPYYEQLQYVGDTRVQSLISLYVGGDARLMREAIVQFDRSRLPEGITQSRYPSCLVQIIPPFSLIWVAMVHDYWMHRDEPAFVRALLPGVRGVLAWYERHVDSTGMVGPTPWWNYVDWTPAWRNGVPPGADRGHSAMTSLLFVYALQRAAQMEDSLGLPAEGSRERALAARITAAVRARTWRPARGLFADAPDSASFSQQTNVMAVLSGAVPAAERRTVMERVLADTTLVRASYYYGFYVLEALREAGLGERYVEQLAPWRGMLALGLTTTPETPEPTRSDSHAWSAHPNYGLLATVLGVRPSAPGFRRVRVAPSLGPLHRAEGRVPHPLGDVEVRLERVGATGVRGEVTLPAGLSGTFVWRGREAPLHAGRQEIRL
ncbi:family 78 glycoside hydrolase catalytic domain [Gemmatirosa kalamazoonensis]|uniref:family 78 glycoside hydrolase catalytic domain n=1 Tax=Gemmatirosa kalamazoonensis TaxID=861299 RepID=UPI00046C9347|nr:family 78 glycoside hydrolase catalytic domain [Gemmatirosa kalamazoonensis]